jgi:ABC-type polysaccharide/polyol phosphate export permease
MNLRIFIELLKQDLKEKNLGSLFGIFWSFVVPLATIIVMWLVFQYGFNRTDIDGYPYSLWYLAGIIPWLYFADAFMQATISIKSKSFLVKKTKFNTIYLPLIKIFSNLLIYGVLIFFLLILYKFYGYKFNIYNLQLIYYLFCLVILLIALSLITSSLILFIKDISEIVALLIRFGMWVTPIFWSIKIVPEKYRFIFYFNPIYYIIEGFRDSLLYKKWFFEKESTVIFWIMTLIILTIGIYLFKRLKNHFGDVV